VPCNEKAPTARGLHIGGFARGKGNFMITEYVPTTSGSARASAVAHHGRILSQYNVGARRGAPTTCCGTRRLLEIHPHDAEERGVRDGDWVKLDSRAGGTALRARITDRVAPGVVYTTFHIPTRRPTSSRRVLGLGDQLPGVQGDRVQVSPSNGPSDWQREYAEQAEHSRRIAKVGRSRRCPRRSTGW